MKRSLCSMISILAIVALCLPNGASMAQRPPTGDSEAPVSVPVLTRGGPAAEKATGPVHVMVELTDAPAVEAWATAQEQGGAIKALAANISRAQLARINQAQAETSAALAALGAQELYRAQRVYNGIAVSVDASKLPEIEKLPNVKAVHTLVPKEIDNATSVPLIGAPDVWKMLDTAGVPFTGKGIKVGIIDTGIDYLHTDFGGPGVSYSPTGTLWISRTFPTAKVVGGWDFVGDNYNADGTGSQLIPQPDPDPMDCNGHGSHVAGTAAGYGVKADGTTYMGPYTSTINFDSFRIGPGVAPEASLYALRVFGCAGSTNVVVPAIEWAADPNGDGDFSDHLDVINMSLGSSYGTTLDPDVAASDNAALAGVVVVASSGNSGDVYYVTGSPAIAGRAMSVAGSVKEGSTLDGFRVNPPSSIAGVYGGFESVAYNWLTTTLPITGTLVYPNVGADPTKSQRTGCYTFDITNTNIISGNFVLLDWTEPSCGGSVARTGKAVAAGAKGVLLADNTQVFDLSITGSSVVPSMSIPKSVGDKLKANLPLSMTFSHEYARSVIFKDPAIVDTVASFSSRGPRRGDSALKPDITAPAVNVFSAAYGTGTKGESLNGTSMAAPHVTGAMALLRQMNPLWTVEELKALAMNTALHDVRSDIPITSTLYGPGRIGAGRVDVKQASQSQVVAYNAGAPGLVSVSFGTPEVVTTATAVRKVKVVNKGSSAATYNVAYNPYLTVPGVTYSVAPSSVTVPAYGAATLVVTMTADAALMKHTHDPAISEAGPRAWLSEAGGYVTLIPAVSTFGANMTGAAAGTPSAATGTAVFTYTASTRSLQYYVSVSNIVSITVQHIHRGLPGVSGGIAYPLYASGTSYLPFGPGTPISGTVTLSAADEALLLSGSLYVNVHTTSYPAGEIRGQIMNTTGQSPLRVTVYAAPRPASDMKAVQSSLTFGASKVISLTGQGLASFAGTTLLITPYDPLSVVTTFELAEKSPQIVTDLSKNGDLKYLGVTSDYKATNLVTGTTIYFGIATWGNWSSPAEGTEFDVYIDTTGDGVPDYVLFNWNQALSTSSPNDVFVAVLLNLKTGGVVNMYPLNGVPASALDTVPFNNSVMVMPVMAKDLGFTSTAKLNYQVVSFSRDASGVVDMSKMHMYDAANPGLNLINPLLGLPGWPDLPGTAVTVNYNSLPAYIAAGSQGVLLLHHHNATGMHDEVIPVTFNQIYLPIIMKQ